MSIAQRLLEVIAGRLNAPETASEALAREIEQALQIELGAAAIPAAAHPPATQQARCQTCGRYAWHWPAPAVPEPSTELISASLDAVLPPHSRARRRSGPPGHD